MDCRPLRWHGSARQAAVLQTMQAQVAAWLRDWSVNQKLLSVAADTGTLRGASTHCIRAAGKNGTAWLVAATGNVSTLGSLLLDAGSDSLDLSRRVGDRAVRALLANLATGLPADITFHEEAGVDACEASGAMHYRLSGSGFFARLVVSAALCDSWAPRKESTLAPLCPRAQALGPETMELQLRLDLGKATLAEARGLRVGDVLVSTSPVDSLFQLQHPDQRALARGRLFRVGPSRALQIDIETAMGVNK